MYIGKGIYAVKIKLILFMYVGNLKDVNNNIVKLEVLFVLKILNMK